MTANKGSWIIANLLPAISSGRTERPGPGAIGRISGASTRNRKWARRVDRHLRLEKWGPT